MEYLRTGVHVSDDGFRKAVEKSYNERMFFDQGIPSTIVEKDQKLEFKLNFQVD